MSLHFRLLICAVAAMLVSGCGHHGTPSYYQCHHPDDTTSKPLLFYPVARQGNLTAWLTSDHVNPVADWLYSPGDPHPKYHIVGRIHSASMPEAAKHDGSFLIVTGYDGPLFDLWEGTDAEARLFTGREGGWIHVGIHQEHAVNTLVTVSRQHPIAAWSGFPLVIGDPDHPQAIAGAMWYKSNLDPTLGGVTSTRMLKRWLAKIRLADFVKP